MDRLRPLLSKLEPKNEQQAYLKTITLSLGEQIITSRWKVYEQMTSSLPAAPRHCSHFMAYEYFFTFGIITPKNSILVGALLPASLSLSAAMYLLLELICPTKVRSLFQINPFFQQSNNYRQKSY